MAIGIRESPDGPAWRTYTIPPSSRFEGYLQIINQQAAEAFLVTCLIDYRQAPCVYEGNEHVLYQTSLGKNEDRLIPIRSPLLEPGFHDLALLAFTHATDHTLDAAARLRTDLRYLYPARIVLLAGGEPLPPSVEFLYGRPRREAEGPLNGVLLNQVSPSMGPLRAWLVQTVRPGEVLNFQVHVGNDSARDMTHAIVIFVDYQQVPIDANDLWTGLISLAGNSRIAIPGLVVVPDEVGIHELMAVDFYSPFRRLEEPISGPYRTLTDDPDFADPSVRVGLIVED